MARTMQAGRLHGTHWPFIMALPTVKDGNLHYIIAISSIIGIFLSIRRGAASRL